MSGYQHWLVTERAHTATLTLNRADEQNSLMPETFYELRDITAYLCTRKDVWAVIVQGQGRSFSTGLDVNTIRDRLDMPEQANREFLLGLQRCMDAFEALEKPTIAKLHGFCLGGGLIPALCCDFRVASQRTVFGLPEVRRGIGVIMGTQRVTRVVGVAATKEMILLGKRFNASAARAYGLVHQIVPPQELDEAVDALADKFRSLPPRTVGISKRIIDQGHAMPLRESQDLEVDAWLEVLYGPDVREAINGFLGNRRPVFTGE